MGTTLANCEILLSKQIGDYWSGTTTSGGSSTTLIDTALMAKNNDWIDSTSGEMYDMVTSGTYDGEERRISSLANSTGTLTTLAHGGTIATSVTYRVHRLFSASDKRIVLISAAKDAYPDIFSEILDETHVSGNWLKDGSFEVWTSSSALTYWTKATSTLAQTSTAYYFKHGSYSCKIDTAAGSIKQSVTNNDDLKYLAGKSVTFTVQGWCDTASCLRIGISDGTTTTYSSYHTGDSAWTENNDPLEVTATIQDNPTAIEFYVYHDVAAGTSYVDDARVISGYGCRIYIGDLGLSENTPHTVRMEQGDYSLNEPWVIIRGIAYDKTNGYMYLPSGIPVDRRLRIEGIGYLDFLASGVSSTAWTATIAINSPQTEILVAQAAIYLLRTIALPTHSTGENQQALNALSFWESELGKRRAKYGMMPPPATVNFYSS